MRLDKTINLGELLTFIGMLFAIAGAYFAIRYDVDLLRQLHDDRITRLEESQRITRESMEKMIDALGSIRTDIAVMRSRMERRDKEARSGEVPRR